MQTATLRKGVETFEQSLQVAENLAWGLRETYDQGKEFYDLGREKATEVNGIASVLQKRAVPIGLAMAKIIYSYRVSRITDAFRSETGRERHVDELHRRNAIMLAELAEQLQGGVIKLGQMLAARGDALPASFVEPLQYLTNQACPMEWDEVEQLLKQAYGERYDHISVDPKRIGSASIAQVHRAEIDGHDVVLKVLRPDIEQILRHDFMALRTMLSVLQTYTADYATEHFVEEIERTVQEETDLLQELAMTQQAVDDLMPLMADSIIVPQPMAEWSTPAVSVYAYVEGDDLGTALAALTQSNDRAGIDKLLTTLGQVYARQIFTTGLLQTDAHSGNFLVTPDQQLVLLDFGSAISIEPEVQTLVKSILMNFVGGNNEALAAQAVEMGLIDSPEKAEQIVVELRQNLGAMLADPQNLYDLQQHYDTAKSLMPFAADINLSALPPQMVMIGRALLTMGGYFVQYKPTIDWRTIAAIIFAA